MANPLQPKCANVLEIEYKAFIVIATATTKSGIMDIFASVPRIIEGACGYDHTLGLFYGFEIKWKTDKPSEIQKQKINELIDAGGRGYFIKSVEQLRDILDNDIPPTRYVLKNKFKL